MARESVAEQFVRILVDAEVERVYGVVGDSLNPVVDAVRRTAGIDWVHVRHEEAGAFAAAAEAQVSGRLTACAGSCGPGNLHLINGLYDAHRSMAPVLALASHIPSSQIGTGYFQETHPERLFTECSHYCEMVGDPAQMPRTLQIAVRYAVGQQGVSVVVLPGDVADRPAAPGGHEYDLVTEQPCVRPGEADVERLAGLIADARKVTLFCGRGCAGAHDEVMELAGRLKAPVGHALRGKEWIQWDNPYDVGMSGLLGYGAAYDAMHECDLLLLLGTDFPYDAFMPTDVRIAQVDIRAENLGRRSRLDHAVWGDVGETVRAVLPRLPERTDRAFLDRMLRQHTKALEGAVGAYTRDVGRHRPIHPEFVADQLDDVAADDAVFTVDTGMCNVWAARYITPNGRRRVIGSFSHGSMANALPQAIGAQLLDRDRQVVAMSGDGGFAMLMGEFLTLLQHDLPVKVVVFNNSSLGMVELEMLVAGLPAYGTANRNPDFAAIARAAGAGGIRVTEPEDVRGALAEALAAPGPYLVDVVTDPHALSMPPKITREQVTGFALSMSKTVLSGGVGKMLGIARSNLRNIPRP
ncbi:pyruvate dehydrogenase [Marinitenerispora sediminis]|uniref:Ubiquinone-dependent pyruvate dehydrogenase n=1 Tax=Marinitenerispora sediminis TaxID=1931232 RepID=A0A368T0C4_9ACTN|nr:pyruvate dehydrogenase [Marinitenerispora sediminis]RCV49583.1 ubiquinone-dependent pyruvate dehydrogenase [Marinitenerispora sediminis]RCV52681.1 ubiquinone-dependent pyruvate dehydrogenase [Marinitenerispora sediminis]RCV53135.1 ubiquinone-dependent pyruvate dehydrogenase [Marinitenerispora sediminis]